MAVGTSNDGKFIASSCKASKAEYASVILWSVESFKKVGELIGHSLTVTSIVFSPDSKWLVTAGRDRSWMLYQRTEEINGKILKSLLLEAFRLYQSNLKAHSRIIWKCTWSLDSLYFATASRDKYLKLWTPSKQEPVFEYMFDEPVTCCDFAPYEADGEYIIAVGLESGMISILYITNNLVLRLKQDLPLEYLK